MHLNISLRHATAALLEQAAESLSVAQRHCPVIMYVNLVRRIRLFKSPFSKQTHCCAHVPLNSSWQSRCNHNPSLFSKAPAQPLPKHQNSKKLLCDAVDAHILRQDVIDGICAVYLVEHRTGVPAIYIGGNFIFVAFDDADWCLRMLETMGVEALSVVQSKAEHWRCSGVPAFVSIKRRNGDNVECWGGIVTLHCVNMEWKSDVIIGVTVFATIELLSRVVAVQRQVWQNAIATTSENGVLKILYMRDWPFVASEENDTQLG